MAKFQLKLLGSVMLMGALCAPAMAEEALAAAPMAEPDWTFPASVTLVSDYIFRGQSQTWGKPALQFGIEADHKSGLYAGFAASNVSDKWLPGASLETDYYAGFRSKLPGAASDFGYDVGAIYYVYPGANWNDSVFTGFNKSNSLNTAEAYLSLSYKWLSFKTGRTLTEYFGWSTNNSPVAGGFNGDPKAGVTGNTKGSIFYELNALYEVVPSWNIIGQLGRQEINNATGLDITYYKAGVSKTFESGWSAAISYSGTNEPDAYKDFLTLSNSGNKSDIAKDKVFVSVSKSF